MVLRSDNSDLAATPRWLHYWAVLTVLLTIALLTLGAEVTTRQVGMVDKTPVRSPMHFLQELSDAGGLNNLIRDKGLGWVIEHSHRTAGWLVGICAIVLAVGLGLLEQRRWLKWAGLAALLGVSYQGILGILRVDMNSTLVALIHGCTAQLVFALLVSVALWTSGSWQCDPVVTARSFLPVRRASLAMVGVTYLQIVLGAVLRHKELALGTRAHVLLAFVVAGVAVWLGVRLLQTQAPGSLGRRMAWIIWGLLALQLMLGLETMLSKFTVSGGYPAERIEPLALAPDLIRSIHLVVGAMLFSASVCMALFANRQIAWAAKPVLTPKHQLEGAL
jgi:cytochrome c oxidase assembly protein subunit 15